jgi:hypothetical protein
MKVLKGVLLVVGLLAIAGAAGLLIYNSISLRILYEVAMSNKSQASLSNPTNLVLIGAGLGAAGGLALGLGIGLPRRTAAGLRHETIEELHRQTTADAAVQAAALHEPVVEPHTDPQV